MEVVMLEDYFAKPSTIDRIRTHWLAPQIERYVGWMQTNGYADHSIARRVPYLCQFANFTARRGVTDLNSAAGQVEEFASHWVAIHRASAGSRPLRPKHLYEVRNPIRQMLRLALEGRIRANRQHKPYLFGTEAPGFLEYLRTERGLRESTVRHYLYGLSRLGNYLKRIGVTSLRELSPALLASFVVDTAPDLSRTSRRNICGELRAFLRFCYREQIVSKDLSAAIEMPQMYRLADVPRSITWDEVRSMLEVVDRRAAPGRRDYAILLLLVTYGLRAHEVANLTLDDIDWKHERLQVPGRKAGHSTAYPLASVVAEALIDYLKHGRPETADRRLFFRNVAPRAPISKHAVSSRVGAYLHKAGIKVHRAGSHTLRHTCVQRLIDAEFPLKTIGDYVGHRSPASTQIYTKVALASLREVAMGDGEAL
jgi:site-specific recombinase XerD